MTEQQWNYLTDMDGVLVHEEHPCPGPTSSSPN